MRFDSNEKNKVKKIGEIKKEIEEIIKVVIDMAEDIENLSKISA